MPQLDLSVLWDEHTKHEFATRDTEATLATMVEDAYVNHIPVMTGANGKAALREFYSRDFIPSMPPDTTLTPISLTVGDAVDAAWDLPYEPPRGSCAGGHCALPRRQT